MPQHRLPFADSVLHKLGSKSFAMRVRYDEWRAVNVATLSYESDNINGTLTVASNPATSEHSEEQLLDLFDNQIATLELDEDEITGIALYTERIPCTFTHGDHGTSAGHRQSSLPTFMRGLPNATFERRNCGARLKERFPDLDIFYTAASNAAHTAFLSFSRRWSQLDQSQKAVVVKIHNKAVAAAEASRLHVQCPANHQTYIWVKPPWGSDEFLEMIANSKCPFTGCNRPVMVLGVTPLTERSVEWMTANSRRSLPSIWANAS